MGTDLAAFLAIVAVGLSGDPLTETWSIGTGFDDAFVNRGIAGTHNKYEGDASIMRVCSLHAINCALSMLTRHVG
jgi:hypothetical protein